MRSLGRKKKKITVPSSCGRLTSSKHFRDPRSWSSDPKKNSEYLLEAVAQLTPTSSRESLLDDHNSEGKHQDSVNVARQGPELNVLIMKDKLSVAADKIRTLEQKNRALWDENEKTNSEVQNLRRFVKDLILHLDYLKSQNGLRRSQMTADAVERIEKIYLNLKTLSNQIDLIGRVNNRFENVETEHEKLKQECHLVKNTLTALEADKNQLIEMIEAKEKDLSELKARAEEANLAVAGASILRERIYAREHQIAQLTHTVEEKTTLIDELNVEMMAMSNTFKKKEDALIMKIEELENYLKEKTDKNRALLEKLHATELLASDLEILKNQLKVTNKSLEESVENYKRQFEKATLSAQLMEQSASRLQREVDAVKTEMEQQAKFPQNANTALYFAHLNKLVVLHDEATGGGDSSRSELVDEIKGVIVKLKKEMWGANVLPSELSWTDATVQTTVEHESKAVDCQPQITSIDTQTTLSDDYIGELNGARQAVLRISQTVQSLETAVDQKTTALVELERQIMTSFAVDDALMTELTVTNDDLSERLSIVADNLKNSTRLLNDALNEVENESKARQSCTNLLETVLQGTVAEYNNYVQVLMMCLKHNEDKLECLSRNIQTEMDFNKEEVESLNEKIEQLSFELNNERNTTTELSHEILNLQDQLDSSRNHCKSVENRSEKCENILKDVATTLECDTIDNIAAKVKSFALELQKYGALNDDLSGQLIKEIHTTRHLRKILRNNRKINKKLKRDVGILVRKHRKSVRAVKSLNRVVDESKRAQTSLTDELRGETEEHERLRVRCLSLTESLAVNEKRLAELQRSLSDYYEKNAADEVHKVKLERFILKLMKRVKKYKNRLNKKLEDKDTLTVENSETVLRDELLSTQIDRLQQENVQLSSTIDELRSRLSSLFAIENNRSAVVSIGCQNSLGDEMARVETESLLANVKCHYESILEALGEDYRAEKEAARRKFTNNLRSMKEAAEREVSEVKMNWTEEIGRIKRERDDEMIRMKSEHDAELLREKESLRVSLLLSNKQEIDAIKENYEVTIKAREKEFRNKINEMNEQESRNKLEHQLKVDRLRAEMKQELVDAEDRHSRAVIRLEQDYNLKIQAIEADVTRRKEQLRESFSQTEGASYQSQGTYTDYQPENPVVYSTVSEYVDIQSIRCEVKNDNNMDNVLSLVPSILSNEGGGQGDGFDRNGHDMLLRKIAELEYKLASSDIQSKKLAMYERQIRLNEMKLNELGSLLEQEVQHSQGVHLRLARQFNRSEILQVEKDEMEKRIKTLQLSIDSLEKQLEKEKDKSYFMKLEIDKLKSQPPGSQKLEESLNRLKNKIDQAVECEKRLTEELQKPTVDVTADEDSIVQYPERDIGEKPIEQIQVIVIKERATLQAWHSHNIY